MEIATVRRNTVRVEINPKSRTHAGLLKPKRHAPRTAEKFGHFKHCYSPQLF